MPPLIPFVVLAYFLLYTFAYSVPPNGWFSQSPLREHLRLEKTQLGPQLSLDAWIKQEEKIALKRLLKNVSPGGSNAPDAAPGTVIASRSREHPNYYYQCELAPV
jgi:glucoamylase